MKSLTGNQKALDIIIAEELKNTGLAFSASEWFELFSASQILKDHDLNFDELEEGIVAGGMDGGIDSVYTFLNGELCREDSSISKSLKVAEITLIVIQSKTSPKFEEDAVRSARESLEDLIDISKPLSELRFNDSVKERFDIFRTTYEKSLTKMPNVCIQFFYATRGTQVSDGVELQGQKLASKLQKIITDVQVEVRFEGAENLLKRWRKPKSKTRTLNSLLTPLGTDAGSFICLCSLSDYFDFICDDGELARTLFEANVRDYEGNSAAVNRDIRQTLTLGSSDDFWYLNNGVTILTPRANGSGRRITIEDPQIVNGLQTSYEIFRFFSGQVDSARDERCILVRVIQEDNTDARDRIIKATNNQTKILPVSLRASDEVHKNIEEYLKPHKIYYDRRRNFYRNQGIPSSSIVGISRLAQAVMATVLLRPNYARARPTTLIKADKDYDLIFNSEYDLDLYRRALEILSATEAYLRDRIKEDKIEKRDGTNIKFYIAMRIAIKLNGSSYRLAQGKFTTDPFELKDSLIRRCYLDVRSCYLRNKGDDKFAKGISFRRQVLTMGT